MEFSARHMINASSHSEIGLGRESIVLVNSVSEEVVHTLMRQERIISCQNGVFG